MKLELAVLILFGLTIILPLSWRNCVKLVLVMVVIEGAIRKWILPGASQYIYFAKDFFMLAAYLKYYSVPRTTIKVRDDPLLRYLVLIAGTVCVVQVANLNLGHPLVGILGARNYLLYIPLMFIMRDLFTSQEDLHRFLRRYLALTIPVCLLAIKQHFSPADSIYNTYAWGNEELGRGYIGSAVRVTGTFSYIAGYSAYLQTCAALVIPLFIIEHTTFWKWIFRFVLISIVVGILLTGSRGPMVVVGLFFVSYFFLNRVVRKLGLFKRYLMPAIFCVIPLLTWFGVQIAAFEHRFSESGDLRWRILSAFFAPITHMEYSGLFGFGTGSTYQGSGPLRQMFGLPEGTPIPVWVEGEPERIMLELGPIGFIAWYFMRLRIIVALWQTFTRLTLPLLRELALTAFLVHLILFLGQMVFHITFLVYFWFLAGFIFLLPQLEWLELNRRKEEPEES